MGHEIRLKRLRYRSWHRGCKETDLILGNFADRRLTGLSPALLDLYEQLLEESDSDIWEWLNGKESSAAASYRPLIDLLKEYGITTT